MIKKNLLIGVFFCEGNSFGVGCIPRVSGIAGQREAAIAIFFPSFLFSYLLSSKGKKYHNCFLCCTNLLCAIRLVLSLSLFLSVLSSLERQEVLAECKSLVDGCTCTDNKENHKKIYSRCSVFSLTSVSCGSTYKDKPLKTAESEDKKIKN